MWPAINFINILRVHFLYEILSPKITRLKHTQRKLCDLLKYKKGTRKHWWNWPRNNHCIFKLIIQATLAFRRFAIRIFDYSGPENMKKNWKKSYRPVVNFINFLHTHFLYKISKPKCWWKKLHKKGTSKMLMKLTPVYQPSKNPSLKRK